MFLLKIQIINLFNFIANFGSEQSCRLYLKKKEIHVSVVQKSIFEYKAVGVINAKSVEIEFPCEVTP